MNNNESIEHIGPAIETPYIPPPGQGFIRKFWQFWESLTLTIVLLTIIIIASTIGTIIPQNGDFGWYVDHYGPSMAVLFHHLGFYDIYKTPWFTFILTMLCISSTVCTAHRYRMLKRSLGHPTIIMKDEYYLQSEHRLEKKYELKPEETIKYIHQNYQKNRYRISKENSNGNIYIYGQKGVLNRWGNLFAHIAVVLVLVGGLIGKPIWPWAFNETLPIVEGDTVGVPYSHFEVRLNKFVEEYYPGTMQPSDFRSYVTVVDQGKEIREEIIRVNHPMKHQGVLFYQNSRAKSGEINGFQLIINDGTTFEEITEWNARIGESFIIPNTDEKIWIAQFLPDFSIGEDMKPVTRSLEPRNPAIEIYEITGSETTGHGWIFANIRLRDLPMKQNLKYDYLISSLEQSWVSIFQVVKDPGVPIVYTGFAILVFGLATTLWLEYRRIWIKISPEGQFVRVQAFGASNRRATDIIKDIDKIIKIDIPSR